MYITTIILISNVWLVFFLSHLSTVEWVCMWVCVCVWAKLMADVFFHLSLLGKGLWLTRGMLDALATMPWRKFFPTSQVLRLQLAICLPGFSMWDFGDLNFSCLATQSFIYWAPLPWLCSFWNRYKLSLPTYHF